MTSTFHYFGFTDTDCIAKASLTPFEYLDNVRYLFQREIVANPDGQNAQNSQKFLYPPVYVLINSNGTTRTLVDRRFQLMDIQTDRYDVVTGLRISEVESGLDRLFYIDGDLRFSNITGLELLKYLNNLLSELNVAGSLTAYDKIEEASRLKAENEELIIRLNEATSKLKKIEELFR